MPSSGTPVTTSRSRLAVSREKTVLATQRVVPQQGTDIEHVRLLFTPDAEGAATYRVSIPVDPGEKLKENNSAEFTIDMQDDRLPVFYIEGSPRQEYRFLRRALFRDKDFRLVSILRLSSTSAEAGAGRRFGSTARRQLRPRARMHSEVRPPRPARVPLPPAASWGSTFKGPT